jgi:predicted DNA-binding transcriptional regulator AlpA
MQLDPLNDRLIPDPQVRQRYGVTDMTLWRWDHTPSLGFPQPIRINKRKFRRLSELLRWEAERAAARAAPELLRPALAERGRR